MITYAVAFLGFSGSGKSTTAMALKINGYPIIADDILNIQFDNSMIYAFNNFQYTKISSKVASFINDDLGLMRNKIKKLGDHYYVFSEDTKSEEMLPFKNMYILEKSKKIGIDTLNSQEAFLNLIRHSYMNKFFN